MKKYLAVIVVCLLSIQGLGGCGLGEKISALRKEFREEGGGDTTNANLDVPEVIIMPDGAMTMDPLEPGAGLGSSTVSKTVLLYFTDQEGEQLVAEEREIAKVEGIARASIESLLEGPRDAGLQSAVPEGTRLVDINIKENGLAIVDFSSDLAENLENSSKKEKMAVYAIVNTLTQFPTVDKVEIRIDANGSIH